MIILGGKDPISEYKKQYGSLPVYCFCEGSYVGMTSRQFGKRIKEHIPKILMNFVKPVIRKVNL